MFATKTPLPVMVSACLLGIRCRYDSKAKPCIHLLESLGAQHVIPVCPEQLGGLPTPRAAASIVGGDGFDVLEGRAAVCVNGHDCSEPGMDVTRAFIRGAEECAQLARLMGVKRCYLKARSPSCGLLPITGVTAARLLLMGIEVLEAG